MQEIIDFINESKEYENDIKESFKESKFDNLRNEIDEISENK